MQPEAKGLSRAAFSLAYSDPDVASPLRTSPTTSLSSGSLPVLPGARRFDLFRGRSASGLHPRSSFTDGLIVPRAVNFHSRRTFHVKMQMRLYRETWPAAIGRHWVMLLYVLARIRYLHIRDSFPFLSSHCPRSSVCLRTHCPAPDAEAIDTASDDQGQVLSSSQSYESTVSLRRIRTYSLRFAPFN